MQIQLVQLLPHHMRNPLDSSAPTSHPRWTEREKKTTTAKSASMADRSLFLPPQRTRMEAIPPASPPDYQFEWPTSPFGSLPSPSSSPPTVDLSPPLIAMVAVVGAAFLVVVYFRIISRHLLPPLLRIWRRRRRRRNYPFSSSSDVESPTYDDSDAFNGAAFHFLSPYGLDETAIKTIPLSAYAKGRRRSASIDSGRECAVCLLEFEENDCVRTLPACSHAFHVDCIDIWLRSHASCPLCRAGIFRPETSPFGPLMSARFRPSLDDAVLGSLILTHTPPPPPPPESDPPAAQEIVPSEPSPRNEVEIRSARRNFLLKRSYSFGFERNLAVDRLVLDTATASPWRYRRGGFWSSKRPSPSPFTSKPRVFSFRGMKSPFFRRRSGFFPLSESGVRFSGAGGGSSRRSKSLTSPFFGRSAAAWSMSGRMRCGDPEALLSPERLK